MKADDDPVERVRWTSTRRSVNQDNDDLDADSIMRGGVSAASFPILIRPGAFPALGLLLSRALHRLPKKSVSRCDGLGTGEIAEKVAVHPFHICSASAAMLVPLLCRFPCNRQRRTPRLRWTTRGGSNCLGKFGAS